MRLAKGVCRLLVTCVGVLVASLFVQAAKADTVDFACGGASACSGTVAANGTNFSSTGIGLTSSIAGDGSDPFTLVFDTSSGSIKILENGVPDFAGTITSYTYSAGSGFTNLNLSVNWTTVPADGGIAPGTTPFSSVISIASNGNAWSVDVPVSTVPAPEPSALVLLAAGLAGVGLLLKTKSTVSA